MVRGRARGFTLLELLVVLLLVGLVSALVVPRMLASLPGVQLKSAARAVAASLRYARSQAVFQTTPYVAAFDGARARLVVEPVAVAGAAPEWGEEPATRGGPEGRRVYELPTGVEVEVLGGEVAADGTETARVLFFPRGDSTGGRVVLRDPRQREYAIIIDPITGIVEIQRP